MASEFAYAAFATQSYMVCFTKTFSTVQNEVTDDHVEKFNTCIQNFVKSYKTIGESWVNHVVSQPDKNRYGPPKFATE